MGIPASLAYAGKHRSRFISELKEFISFPSVSAQPSRAQDVRRCAEWLAAHLGSIGLQSVRVFSTGRHPIVYGEWLRGSKLPTLLIYGHYDVQPPEPLKEWQSPPFAPVIRGEYLYGRGASDDKGQMFAHVKALECYLKADGGLPVNVKCIFEGEEEIGSPNLHAFIRRNRTQLNVDAAVVSDMPIPAPDKPALTYAVRGGLSLELELKGSDRDLHSGLYGGAVRNPLETLARIVGVLHGRNGRVALPGFYDGVRRISDSERSYMTKVGPLQSELLKHAGTADTWGEQGFNAYERTTIRPALTVNGITGGYQGAGSKGVIPARASAKISFRLVPDQDPNEVEEQFREYLEEVTPTTLECRLRACGHAHPVVLSTKHPAMRAAAFAYERGFGKAPIFVRCGGTIPIVDTFREALGIPTVLMGFALPDDAMHAPNEKFFLPNFFRGVDTSIWFLQGMQGVSKRSSNQATRESEMQRSRKA
jgi:acetylornithine deacetylase/succinyl-diaminopimelate desuccinylase-like protein